MARIRAIKPEFWSSPSLPKDPWARLLFMAMWNWADDNGVGTANPRELLGFAFPNDEELTLVDLRRMLVEINDALGVMFYTVEGRPYYSIPSWEKHQKFDRRSKGRFPGPEQAETWLYQQEHKGSTETHEPTTSTRRDSVAGTGEQWNRGTVLKTLEQPAVARTPKAPNRFEEFWAAYPRKVDKKKAKDAFDVATKTTDPELIIAGAMRHAADPNRTDQFTKHPTTWLRAGSWDNDPLPPRNDSGESQAMKNARSIQQRFHQPQALDEPWLIGGPNGNPERN